MSQGLNWQKVKRRNERADTEEPILIRAMRLPPALEAIFQRAIERSGKHGSAYQFLLSVKRQAELTGKLSRSQLQSVRHLADLGSASP